jgi:hypothetical protein
MQPMFPMPVSPIQESKLTFLIHKLRRNFKINFNRISSLGVTLRSGIQYAFILVYIDTKPQIKIQVEIYDEDSLIH